MIKARCLLAFICVCLSACGGGGSKSSEPQTDLLEGFNTSQAVLTRQNALSFLHANQQFVDLIHGFSGDVIGFLVPPLENHDSILADEIQCPEENYSVKESKRSLRVRFFDCQFEGYKVNGEVFFKYENSLNDGSFIGELSFLDFRLTGDHSDIVYNGMLYSSLVAHEFVTGSNSSLKLTDRLSGGSYAWTEVVSSRSRLNAKIYDENIGWVRVEYEPENETVSFSGAHSSRLIARAQFDSEGVSRELESYALTLIDEGGEASYQFNRPVPLVNLDILPSLEPVAPSPDISGDEAPFRTLVTNYSGAQSQDTNFDAFTYSWTVGEAREGCFPELENADTSEVSAIFPCQGDYELNLTVTDWSGSNTASYSISVQPLAAEISTPSNIVVGQNQSLDVALQIDNLQEDGPFNFSLLAAPNGISVDERGRITGVPRAFISEGDTQFTIVAEAENGLTSKHIFNIQYINEVKEPNLITWTELCHREEHHSWGYIDNNAWPDLVCTNDEAYRVIEMRDGEISTIYAATKSLSPNYKIMDIAQQDVTNDGQDEILLGYDDRIFVISGDEYKILAEIPTPWYDATPEAAANGRRSSYRFHAMPGGGGSVAVSAPNLPDHSSSLYLFDLDGDYVRFNETMPRDRLVIANIDDDPQVEAWVMYDQFTVFYDLGFAPVELPVKSDFLADVTGDGQPELVEFQEAEFTAGVGWSAHVMRLYESTTGNLIYQTDLDVGPSYNNSDFHVFDVDSDSAYEIVVLNKVEQALYVFDWHGEALSMTSRHPEPEYSSNAVYLGIVPNGIVLDYFDYFQASYTFSQQTGFDSLRFLTPRRVGVSGSSKVFARSEGYMACYTHGEAGGYAEFEFTESGEVLDYRNFRDLQLELDRVSELKNGELIVTGERQYDGSISHQVFDSESEALLGKTTFEGESNYYNYHFGDINGDGELDTIASGDHYGELQWFSAINDSLYWKNSSNEYLSNDFPVRVIDIDGDGRSEILAVRTRTISTGQYPVVSLYKYNNSIPELVAEFPLAGSNEIYTFGFQDMDADGTREVIVAETELYNCRPGENSSDVYVLDKELNLQESVEVAECITSVPDFPDNYVKRNIIVAVTKAEAVANSQDLAFTTLVEISAKSPHIVWESKAMLGLGRRHSLHAKPLGEGSELKAVLSTSAGIYLLR